MVVGYRLLILLHLFVCASSAVKGELIMGNETNGNVIVGYRPVELVLVVVGASPPVIRERIIRV